VVLYHGEQSGSRDKPSRRSGRQSGAESEALLLNTLLQTSCAKHIVHCGCRPLQNTTDLHKSQRCCPSGLRVRTSHQTSQSGSRGTCGKSILSLLQLRHAVALHSDQCVSAHPLYRVINCLEMSGNLTAVREVSGNSPKVREMSGEI